MASPYPVHIVNISLAEGPQPNKECPAGAKGKGRLLLGKVEFFTTQFHIEKQPAEWMGFSHVITLSDIQELG